MTASLTLTCAASARNVDRCPACEGGDFEPVSEFADGFYEHAPHYGAYQPPYRVLACTACGLNFKSVTMALDDLTAYYDGLDFAPFDGDYDFPTDEAVLSILRAVHPGGRVLDFGCSTGRILQRLGPGHRRYGVEVNCRAAAVALSRGISILTEREVVSGSSGEFDAVVLTDVFEHLVRPTDTLAALARIISKGGALILVTGLADAISMPGYEGEHWYYRIHGHLQMMTLRHAAWLARRLGFEQQATRTMSHYSVPLARKLRQAAQGSAYRMARKVRAGSLPAFLASIPPASRAVRWANAPALTFAADHVVIEYRKRTRAS